MIKFELTQHDYRDSGGHYKSRVDRDMKLIVRFWNFTIDGNLTELAFVKSTLNYFMQAYWKRTSIAGRQSLYFVARQKDKKHFLQICLQQRGTTVNESYLDGQEVIMLDFAIGKAINLLTPVTINHEQGAPGFSN